jgi:hypothetical protein
MAHGHHHGHFGVTHSTLQLEREGWEQVLLPIWRGARDG